MRLRKKTVRYMANTIDDIVKLYKKDKDDLKNKRDWKTYEQQHARRISAAARELKPLIEKAYDQITVERESKRGRPPKIGSKEKTLILLLQQIFDLSNRKMSNMLLFFSLLTGEEISYKTVERAYSDPIVQIILHNMFALMIKDKEIKDVDLSGDGTGYSLSIKKHYRDSKDQDKNRRDFVYYFSLLDLDTYMYVAYGVSRRSEKDAYNRARSVLIDLGINVKSVRLDKYYSNKSIVYDFDPSTSIYVIPKINATIKGSKHWKETLTAFVHNVFEYLGQYFKRNMSECMFSVDKKMFGGFVRQKLTSRIGQCLLSRTVLHNLFWMFA